MKKFSLLATGLMLMGPGAAFAQGRPAEAVAQDGSDAPPLAKPHGPLDDIPDNFDTSVGGPYRYADPNGIPGGEFNDNVGAFRLTCGLAKIGAFDPIVSPGLISAAHLHTFFGNTDVNPNSTYESLRASGESSCNNRMWRSAYWIPSLLSGPGPDAKVKLPYYLNVYYKRHPKSSAYCTPGNPKFVGRCETFPNGLEAIANYDMVTKTAPSGSAKYKCIIFWDGNRSGESSEFIPDMVTALSQCPTQKVPSGATGVVKVLDMAQDMPQCWDGKNLKSPNHRSHMADTLKVTGVGEFCPKTHPVFIPGYTAQTTYVIDSDFDLSGTWEPGRQTVYLSSDRMPGQPIKRPGTTNHFDIISAPSPLALTLATDNCIDKQLSCSGGVLGDGTGMRTDPAFPIGVKKPDVVRPKMAVEAAHGEMHGPM